MPIIRGAAIKVHQRFEGEIYALRANYDDPDTPFFAGTNAVAMRWATKESLLSGPMI